MLSTGPSRLCHHALRGRRASFPTCFPTRRLPRQAAGPAPAGRAWLAITSYYYDKPSFERPFDHVISSGLDIALAWLFTGNKKKRSPHRTREALAPATSASRHAAACLGCRFCGSDVLPVLYRNVTPPETRRLPVTRRKSTAREGLSFKKYKSRHENRSCRFGGSFYSYFKFSEL